MAAMSYVPALDGVRALAVTAVLCFHGGMPWAAGGSSGSTLSTAGLMMRTDGVYLAPAGVRLRIAPCCSVWSTGGLPDEHQDLT